MEAPVPTDDYELAGTHNSSDLNLFWESDSPVTVNRDLHLTEYRLVNMWSNFSVANYSLTADVRTAFGLQSRLYGKFGEYTRKVHIMMSSAARSASGV
jgi:hypothetical protein